MKDDSFETCWRCEVPLVSKGQGEYREDTYPEDIHPCAAARGILNGMMIGTVMMLVLLAGWLVVGWM